MLRRAVQSIEDYQRKDHALRHLREQTGLRDLVLGRKSVGSALPLEFPLVVGVVKASPAGWQRLVDGYSEWVRWSVAIDQAHTVVLVPLPEMERLQAGLVAEHLVSSWSGAVNALSEVHPAFLEARQALESSSGPGSLRIDHVGPNNPSGQKFPYGDWFFVMDEMVQAAETLSGSAWFKGCDRLAEWSLDPAALDTMRPVVLELMYRIQKTVLGRSAESVVSTEWLAMIGVIEEAKAMCEVTECLRGALWALLEREEQGRAKEKTSLEQQRALAFITSHLSSDLSAQATAEYLGMSLSQFSRWFQDSMGQHYLEYVTKLRIERARWLLATSDAPVAVIASQVGYSDARYFKHVFRERVGLGPGAFRSSTAAKKPNP